MTPTTSSPGSIRRRSWTSRSRSATSTAHRAPKARPASSSTTGSRSTASRRAGTPWSRTASTSPPTLDGSGGGYSLIYNSHLDTTLRPDAVWSAKDPKDPLYHSAWVDGEDIYGDGVVNDKGPMAAFLVAAKAIKEAGYPLKGDLIVSAVAGEISREPIEEWQGPALPVQGPGRPLHGHPRRRRRTSRSSPRARASASWASSPARRSSR